MKKTAIICTIIISLFFIFFLFTLYTNTKTEINGEPKKEWPCPGQPIEWVPAGVFGRTVVVYDCFCNKITYSEVIKRCE